MIKIAALAASVVALAVVLMPAKARAVPPVAQVSPGYEARIAEQRAKLRQATQPRIKPARPRTGVPAAK